MLGLDSTVPLGVVVSSPPKMFGWEDEREPSGEVVSKPPKMFGVEEERPSGLVQSWPPKMLGWQETSPLLARGKMRSPMIAATPSDAGRCQLRLSMTPSRANTSPASPSRHRNTALFAACDKTDRAWNDSV